MTKLSDDHKQFIRAYVEAALWSTQVSLPQDSTKDDDETEYITLDEWDGKISLSTLRKMHKNCKTFLSYAEPRIKRVEEIASENRFADAGQDFWLTQHRHGAGFWDGDWPSYPGLHLTELSLKFNPIELYIGDDGDIYS